ncbi:MAG: hypothetical protein RQ833_07475 [Sphingomonadaceae bacterium]|nr:hypothetical protein [Sphingomonadaceae bacterium]
MARPGFWTVERRRELAELLARGATHNQAADVLGTTARRIRDALHYYGDGLTGERRVPRPPTPRGWAEKAALGSAALKLAIDDYHRRHGVRS